MKEYYVIGYYPDSRQRFASAIVEADSHGNAEMQMFNENPGLVIVGSFYVEDGCPVFDTYEKVRTA